MVANVERESPQCPLNQMFIKSMAMCSIGQQRKLKSSAELSESPSMSIPNISPISWAQSQSSAVLSVTTPTRKSPPASPPRGANSLRSKSPQQQQGMTYHSPETIKLQLPGTSSPSKSVLPTALLHTPKRMLKMLRGQPSAKTVTPQQLHEDNSPWTVANFFEGIPSDFFDGESCSCISSSATTITAGSGAAYTARLTEDVLQQHEHLVKKSPSRQSIPNFAGDKLAKTVIRKKTQYEISKENKQRSKRQLGGEFHSIVEESDQRIETVLLQDALPEDWLEMERQTALAEKWQRKKAEQNDRMRLEQLRWSELERQRNLRAAEIQRQQQRQQSSVPYDGVVKPTTPVKEDHDWPYEVVKPCIVSPSTPRTHHKTTRLIHI